MHVTIHIKVHLSIESKLQEIQNIQLKIFAGISSYRTMHFQQYYQDNILNTSFHERRHNPSDATFNSFSVYGI